MTIDGQKQLYSPLLTWVKAIIVPELSKIIHQILNNNLLDILYL